MKLSPEREFFDEKVYFLNGFTTFPFSSSRKRFFNKYFLNNFVLIFCFDNSFLEFHQNTKFIFKKLFSQILFILFLVYKNNIIKMPQEKRVQRKRRAVKRSRKGKLVAILAELITNNTAAMNGMTTRVQKIPQLNHPSLNAVVESQREMGMPSQSLGTLVHGANVFAGLTKQVYTLEKMPAEYQTIQRADGEYEHMLVHAEFTAIVPSVTVDNFIRRLLRDEVWTKMNGPVAFVNQIVASLRVCPLLRIPNTALYARGFEENAVQTMASMIAVVVDNFQTSRSDEYDYKTDTSVITEYLDNPRDAAQKLKFTRCRPLSAFIYTVSIILLAGNFTVIKNVDASSNNNIPNALGEAVRASFKNLFAVGLSLLDDTAGYLNVVMCEGFLNSSRKALASGKGVGSSSTSDVKEDAAVIPDDARADAIIAKSNAYLTLWYIAHQADAAVTEDCAPRVAFTSKPKTTPVPTTVIPSVPAVTTTNHRPRGANYERNQAKRARKQALLSAAAPGVATVAAAQGPLLATPTAHTPAAGVAAAHAGKRQGGRGGRGGRWN